MGGIMPNKNNPFLSKNIPKGLNENDIIDRHIISSIQNSHLGEEEYCFFCSKPLILDGETTIEDLNRKAHRACLQDFMERQRQKYEGI